jgi:phage/plasmid-like protein (TIGR03299 family)
MSHEIDMTGGIARAAFARTPAWHGLGKVLPGPMTTAEAIEFAGLNWEVELRQVHRPNNAGDLVALSDRFAVVRKDFDKVLGIVGSTYKPLQNVDQASFLDAVVGEGCRIDSAGSLYGGKKVWFLCKMADCFEVVPDDVVEPYLLTCNGHDGCLSWSALMTGVRVVCQNTLSAALDGLEGRGFGKVAKPRGLKLRHDGRMTENIEQARIALGLARTRAERMKEEAEALVRKTMRTSDLSQFFVDQVEKMKLHREREELILADLAQRLESPTNSLNGMRGTAWQAFNVWSEWVDHSPRRMGADTRLESIWMGEGAKQKSDAWAQLLSTAV